MPKPKYNHPFIKFVRHECRRYKVKFMLQHENEIKNQDEGALSCGGYFTDTPAELAVATRISYTDFLSTLVHEYSHMTQWIDNSPYYIGHRGFDSWDIIERWINGEDFTRSTIRKSINIVRDCELDCDRRAVELIKKFRIPINIDRYCRKSSAYIYFHNFMKITRRWEYKEMPSNKYQIINKMPTNLNGDYSRTPRKIMALFKKYMH